MATDQPGQFDVPLPASSMLSARLEEFQQTYRCNPTWAMESAEDDQAHRATLEWPSGSIQGEWARGKAAGKLSAVNKALDAASGALPVGAVPAGAGAAAALAAGGVAVAPAAKAGGSSGTAAVRAALKAGLEAFQQMHRYTMTWEMEKHLEDEQLFRAKLTWPTGYSQGEFARGKAAAKLSAVKKALEASGGGSAALQLQVAAQVEKSAAAMASVASSQTARGPASLVRASLKERLEAFQQVYRCIINWNVEQSPDDEQQFRASLAWPGMQVHGEWACGKPAAQLSAVTKALEQTSNVPLAQVAQAESVPQQQQQQQQKLSTSSSKVARAALKAKMEAFQKVYRCIISWNVEKHATDEQQFRAQLDWPGGQAQGEWGRGKVAAKLSAVSQAIGDHGPDPSAASKLVGNGQQKPPPQFPQQPPAQPLMQPLMQPHMQPLMQPQQHMA